MSQDLDRILEKYYIAREDLLKQSADSWAEVIKLCAKVPENIDLETIWMFGRDKPCWSNIKVAGGERIAQDLEKSSDFDSFKTIASDDWLIVKTGSGYANSKFTIIGHSVKSYLASLSEGGFASYKWKLFSTRQLALAFANEKNRIHELIDEVVLRQVLDSQRIGQWTKKFHKLAGFGWGYVTTNHMLADLGLSIKPDLHVRRSGVKLGLTSITPTTLTDSEIDGLSAAVDFEIVRTALALAKYIDPLAKAGLSGAKKNKVALREMDKTLMEWSRQGLARPL